MAESETDTVGQGYDAVYAAMPNSPTLLRIWRQHAMGEDYPEGFESISFLSLAELQRLKAELALAPGQTLVDLGCGMGGPALWVTREAGAELVGMDVSSVAVERATDRARDRGLAEHARFVVGSFAQTGLLRESADGCMSVDALQYAPDKRAALVEAARILRPGGRLAFLAFELHRERAANLPVLSADPVEDFRPLLSEAGFSILHYEETAGWDRRLKTAYQAILDAEGSLSAEMGQAAWFALSLEVSLTLQHEPYQSHVLAVAERLGSA